VSSLRDHEAFEYSPALETSASAKLKAHYRPFIDGAFVDGGGQVVQCVNPATEQPLTEVSYADERDVDTAVRAARRAYDKVWSKMAGAERGKYLFRIARLVAERAPELAVLETLQSGKPIRQSREFDLPAAAGQLFYYAGWADKLAYAGYGGGPQGNGPRPLGVVALLVPGNFPLLTAAAKVAAALACGNTVVLKPAESTPLTALVLAEICQQAQLPPGVLNVVPGAADLGAALVAHREVDKIGFAGSTAVGKQIQRHIAGTRKRLTMELGGKSATVVFDDAPLEQAVDGVVNGFVFNQGQLGCAGSRVLVQEPIAQELLDRLRSRIAQLRVGDPLDKNTDVGALSSAAAVAQLGELVAAGVAEGATRGRATRGCRSRGSLPPQCCSPTYSPPCASRGRSSSGRCCPCSPSGRPTRRWPRPTTRRTASRPGCGPRRVRECFTWRNIFARASCGPTPCTGLTPRPPSAVTPSPAWAGRAAWPDWRAT